MYQLINVGAAAGGEAFLLLGGEKTALIDSGYSFSAKQMTENIKQVLDGRPLDYVLLTHSHFDHASGSAMCRHVWPEVKICSSEYAAKVFTKESAAKTMEEMNMASAKMCGMPFDKTVPVDLFTDIIVHEHDIIDLGGLTLEVFEAPGHTRGSVCYWCKEEKLLLGCETFGVPSGGKAAVMPSYIVGYQMTIDSIKKAAALGAEHYLVPHYIQLHGQEVTSFFKDALYWAEEVKNMIVDGHKAGKSDEELVQEYKALFYTEAQAEKQSETAFMTNVRHKIPVILRECL